MAIKYGIKEVADVTFYDLTTSKPILFLDTLKTSSLENKADSTFARGGKGNAKLLGFDYNRESLLKISDALITTKGLSMYTGNAVQTGVQNVYEREVLTAVVKSSDSTVTLSQTPITNSVTVYKIAADGTGLADVAVKAVTGNSVDFLVANVAVGDVVVVYYQYATAATAQKILISADKFPPYVKVVGDTVIRNAANGLDEAFQFIIHKAKISPTFNLNLTADGEPTTFDMELECFRRDADTEMIQLIKY